MITEKPRRQLRGIRHFFLRQADAHLETTFAFFFMYAAIAGIFSFGVAVTPLAKVLGPIFSKLIYVIYFTAGCAMYFGVGLGRGNLEAFGLILIITCLVLLMIASGWLLGIHPATINGFVFNSAFSLSFTIRLLTLWKAQKILEANGQS